MWRAPQEVAVELDRYRPDVITSYGSYLEALFTHLLADEADHHLPASSSSGPTLSSSRFATRSGGPGDRGPEHLQGDRDAGSRVRGEAHRGYHLNVDLCPGAASVPTERRWRRARVARSSSPIWSTAARSCSTTARGPCPRCTRSSCGRTLPVLSYLQGHAVPWLDLGRGRTIHPQAVRARIRRERDLRRYQIVQEGRRRVPHASGRGPGMRPRDCGEAFRRAVARQPWRRRCGSRRICRGPGARPRRHRRKAHRAAQPIRCSVRTRPKRGGTDDPASRQRPTPGLRATVPPSGCERQ